MDYQYYANDPAITPPDGFGFDTADYYSVYGNDRDLAAGTPEDAIRIWHDDLERSRGSLAGKAPRESVRVFAFKQASPEIPAGDVLDYLVEHLTQDSSRYADGVSELDGQHRTRAVEILQPAIDAVIALAHPWYFKRAGSRVYTAEQIAAIVGDGESQ